MTTHTLRASEQSSTSALNSAISDLPILEVSLAAVDFAPSTHIGKNGRFSGRKGETIRMLCQIGRMDCTFRVYPANGAYAGFERGRHDALLTSEHKRFEDCCTFSSYQTPWTVGIIAAKGSIIPTNEAELIGSNIIMVRGWQSPYKAFPNLDDLIATGQVKVTNSDSIVSSIKMFQKGRAPLLWGSDVFDWHFNHLKIDKSDLKFKELVSIPSGIWVSKASLNHDEILNRIDFAVKTLTDQGSLENNILKPALLDAVYEDAIPPH